MVSVQKQIDFKSLLTRLPQDTQATIVFPHDPEYNHLLQRYTDASVRPAGAIFLPTTAQDVSVAIKFVNEHSIDMAVCCGGHSGSGASSSNGGLVIDLRKMKEITVDEKKKTLTCGGGCLWKDVDFTAAKYGLACVGGSVNHTGIGGLTLGGGYGFLSGLYGLTIDNLLSVEMVLASGEIVTASNEENQELFWAIRGAGANFGVATKFVYQGHDQKNKIVMGPLVFPPNPTVISGVLDFCNSYFSSETLDGKAAMAFVITTAPPDFKNPAFMVMIFYNGSPEEVNKVFKPLLDLNPVANMMTEMPYEEANGVMAAMATYGGRKLSRGFTIKLPLKLDTVMDAYDIFKDFVGKYSDDPQIGLSGIVVELMSHKKINENKNGCFANRGIHSNGTFMPRWTNKENDEDIANWARRNAKKITHANGVVLKDGREPVYSNFDANLDDAKATPKDIFGDSYEKLVELKAKYDPKNLFNKWHSLVPEKSM